MASEFQDLGRLGEALLALGEVDGQQLAAKTRLPAGRVEVLVERAIEVGLAERESETIRLTASGAAFALSLRELEAQARRAGQERFRPYTEYIPAGWSIE
ncbi:MAG TPA: hypothetical protein VFA19_07440 [Gaiellaceae bacterium]|nr:hypothetical protein [Gaiellaceae bacterium]